MIRALRSTETGPQMLLCDGVIAARVGVTQVPEMMASAASAESCFSIRLSASV